MSVCDLGDNTGDNIYIDDITYIEYRIKKIKNINTCMLLQIHVNYFDKQEFILSEVNGPLNVVLKIESGMFYDCYSKKIEMDFFYEN